MTTLFATTALETLMVECEGYPAFELQTEVDHLPWAKVKALGSNPLVWDLKNGTLLTLGEDCIVLEALFGED